MYLSPSTTPPQHGHTHTHTHNKKIDISESKTYRKSHVSKTIIQSKQNKINHKKGKGTKKGRKT